MQLCHPEPVLAVRFLVREHPTRTDCHRGILLRPRGERSPSSLCYVNLLILCYQTTFDREAALKQAKKNTSDRSSVEKSLSEVDVESDDHASQIPQPTYKSQLKVWHGTFTDESLWRTFLRPFPFLLSPVVCMSATCSVLSSADLGLDMVPIPCTWPADRLA